MDGLKQHTKHFDDLSRDALAKLAARLFAQAVQASSGCWILNGHQLHSGHVHLYVGSPRNPPCVRVRAHVFAWELANHQSVPDGYVVMHSCDQPNCVNPKHLSIGTQGDNVHDSVRKGRFSAWRRPGLTAEGVLEIRRRVAAGEPQKAVAADVGITQAAVSHIVSRRSWAHLPETPPSPDLQETAK